MTPLFCNLCGRRVEARAVRYRRSGPASPGLVVCARCDQEAARCRVCQIPLAPGDNADGLCPACAAVVPRCAICGQPALGRYYRNEITGAVACAACFSREPRCHMCGAPAGAGSTRLHDGRVICAGCHATAVFDAVAADALYTQTTAILEKQLGLGLSLRPALVIVDRRQMEEVLAQAQSERGDPAEMVFGLFVRRGRRRAIYVESGLPQILMIQVIAHEYAHAWQGENCPLLRDPLVREGFAEWTAHRTLRALGAVKKAALMEQRADLYGQGLQMMLAVERKAGVAGVVELCRAANG